MSWSGYGKTVLVHDWLNGMRGGERCLELIGRQFPEAPIYTLLYRPEAVSDDIRAHEVRVSGLQRLPGFAGHYRWFLPLFPWAVETFRAEADVRLVLSTSHCVAKGFRAPEGAKHVCYCFTPMRYAWELQAEYFGKGGLKRTLLDPFLKRRRKWDRESAGRVDRFVAISRHVQARIREHYGRESSVVYPPVATEFYTPDGASGAGAEAAARGDYDLVVSALVPYKRIDLAVEAYALSGRRLVVAGAGSELAALKKKAPANVEFAGRPDDAAVRELYRGCRMLVFPGEEDFGIVPVEAQACGKPVVAFGKGGLLETVREGETGVFFGEQTAEALAAAVEKAAGMRWDAGAIRANAERFSRERFLAGLERELDAATGARR